MTRTRYHAVERRTLGPEYHGSRWTQQPEIRRCWHQHKTVTAANKCRARMEQAPKGMWSPGLTVEAYDAPGGHRVLTDDEAFDLI